MIDSNSVIIIDKHPIVRLAIRAVLERRGIKVLADISDGVDGLRLANLYHPDLVTFDIGQNQTEGLAIIKQMSSLSNAPSMLIFCTYPAVPCAEYCLRAGASGFVSKRAGIRDFLNAIEAIFAGYDYFPYYGSVKLGPTPATK
ncbi:MULTISPECIES: response regulator [Pseudomonas]|uniref:response regulator n=1 Tax=Pseudomonas TaxID=286 RepID=UPI000F583F88|nr:MULTISPECIES: response regulator [Pseudomonas]MDQ0980389.1 DNA-binding NarL/FixJ family response regulator [Pseudomonas synxantha]